MKTFLNIVLIVIGLDFVGFVAWALSGQIPVDGFFIGRLTFEFIHLFI